MDITKLAKQAHLKLSEEEQADFESEFARILSLFDVLDSCDVSEVQPSFRPVESFQELREDVVEESKFDGLANVVHRKDRLVIGPKTI